MIIQTYYISTGKLNAMYTLRCRRDARGQSAMMAQFMPDFYICNLAATVEKAVEKALAYVEAMIERVPNRDDFQTIFIDEPECYVDRRRGKMSAKETRWIETIESGFFPFGKHAGKAIESVDAGYILFFADKMGQEGNDAVMMALSAACAGVALEKGYIAAREVRREEIAAQNAKSNFVGNIGERIDIEGTLVASIRRGSDYDGFYWINKVLVGDDMIVYIGKSLGEKGDSVVFRATVKSHDEYNGTKSTKVGRPYLYSK